MRGRIEEKLKPIMNLVDKFGEVWRLEQRPVFYPNMQIHLVIYSDSFGTRKNVRFDWDGNVIGGDFELGDLILAKI